MSSLTVAMLTETLPKTSGYCRMSRNAEQSQPMIIAPLSSLLILSLDTSPVRSPSSRRIAIPFRKLRHLKAILGSKFINTFAWLDELILGARVDDVRLLDR